MVSVDGDSGVHVPVSPCKAYRWFAITLSWSKCSWGTPSAVCMCAITSWATFISQCVAFLFILFYILQNCCFVYMCSPFIAWMVPYQNLELQARIEFAREPCLQSLIVGVSLPLWKMNLRSCWCDNGIRMVVEGPNTSRLISICRKFSVAKSGSWCSSLLSVALVCQLLLIVGVIVPLFCHLSDVIVFVYYPVPALGFILWCNGPFVFFFIEDFVYICIDTILLCGWCFNFSCCCMMVASGVDVKECLQLLIVILCFCFILFDDVNEVVCCLCFMLCVGAVAAFVLFLVCCNFYFSWVHVIIMYYFPCSPCISEKDAIEYTWLSFVGCVPISLPITGVPNMQICFTEGIFPPVHASWDGFLMASVHCSRTHFQSWCYKGDISSCLPVFGVVIQHRRFGWSCLCQLVPMISLNQLTLFEMCSSKLVCHIDPFGWELVLMTWIGAWLGTSVMLLWGVLCSLWRIPRHIMSPHQLWWGKWRIHCSLWIWGGDGSHKFCVLVFVYSLRALVGV